MVELLKQQLKSRIAKFCTKTGRSPDTVGILYLNKGFYFVENGEFLEEIKL